MTFTLITERLTVDLSLPVLTIKVCHDWDSNTQPSAREADSLTHCATAVVVYFVISSLINNYIVLLSLFKL